MKKIAFSIFLFSFSINATAQEHNVKVLKKNKFSGFPVAYYTPETKLAAGGFGAYTFYNKNDSNQKYPSQIQIGAAYTFNKQLLIYFPFRIYTKHSNFTAYGEAGYYKYSYFFYGIGNNQPNDYKELYKVNFPRIRINLLKKVAPNLFIGVRYWLEDYKIKETEPGKQLASGTIPGTKNNFISGIGPAFNFDSRDNIFSPSKGLFVDGGIQLYGKGTGSNYRYNRYTADASFFISNRRKNVYAFNLFGDFLAGDVIPFNQLALMGGNKKMRGYYEGRYRDKDLIALAGEFRFHIYKRFGAVTFANAGAVNDKLKYIFTHIRTSIGVGARYALNKSEKLNIRLDAAFAKNSSGLYFTIGEAF